MRPSSGQESQEADVRCLRDGHLSRNSKEGVKVSREGPEGTTFWANEQPLQTL